MLPGFQKREVGVGPHEKPEQILGPWAQSGALVYWLTFQPMAPDAAGSSG